MLGEKIGLLKTVPTMVPYGAMYKDRLSGLYTADEMAWTWRDELLSRGLIVKKQDVTAVISEEVVEEVENIHEIEVKILDLEGIERAFENVDYLENLFNKRLQDNDFRVSYSEEYLSNLSEKRIQGYDLGSVKGEIRSLKKQKKELLLKEEAEAIEVAIDKIIKDEINMVIAEVEAEAKAKAEAEVEAKAKAEAKETKVINEVIKTLVEEDVAEAGNMSVVNTHKILVKVQRQENATIARQAKAEQREARKRKASQKAAHKKIKAMIGKPIKLVCSLFEKIADDSRRFSWMATVVERNNVSFAYAWDWFEVYDCEMPTSYRKNFI